MSKNKFAGHLGIADVNIGNWEDYTTERVLENLSPVTADAEEKTEDKESNGAESANPNRGSLFHNTHVD